MDAPSSKSSTPQNDSDSGPYSPPSLIPPHDGSPGPDAKKEKGRVRFNSNAAVRPLPVVSNPQSPAEDVRETPIPKPRPSVLRGNSANSVMTLRDFGDAVDLESERSATAAAAAKKRAEHVAARVHRDIPPSSRNSLESIATVTSERPLVHGSYGIPLQDLTHSPLHEEWTQFRGEDDLPLKQDLQEEALKLVRQHTHYLRPSEKQEQLELPTVQHKPRQEGDLEELNEGSFDGVYGVPPPKQYRGSVLSQLLKLYSKPGDFSPQSHKRNSSFGGSFTPGTTSGGTTPGSATPTRRKWYEQNKSQDTLANLIEASAKLANPNLHSEQPSPGGKKKSGHKRSGSASRLTQMWQNQETRITIHIAETLSRQNYIIKLCRALMLFGAPTHRLEEYLSMSARVLEIDGQFLYLPGCMIISFDDKSTHTTEVRIVRTAQGIDLGKLKDVHHIYKEVMHDVIGVEEGTSRLDILMTAKDKFNPWLRVLLFGLTSATAGPFSFSARLIDLPLSFCFGCLVGILQLIVAPKSQLYSNVFEVSATVLVSFMARAFGSLRGGNLFCFSAMAQSGIVMLLPGYSVLCSALELQSRALVPGSIRIVYAIIYSLLLGYGITVGATLWGLFDDNATSETTCSDPLSSHLGFIFVPFFVVCISMIYQAKWRQMPVMVVIACTGYVVNFYSSKKFSASPSISNTLGAFAVGILANLYSRLRHGVAAATLIPAIFTQVPGGLASTGGLLSGLSTANSVTNSTHVVNGTSSVRYSSGDQNTVIFDVAASMIQIAIGIAVGLFMSALVIYPLGKRRSGLFSF
ncbi:hypothetical protein BGZ63DRAFT_255589 [Mariannaea sp. PMI_226]|nr:hypothetical protein BGZ63DRAFT_255589 [Mariannaea sp. PMI_226]